MELKTKQIPGDKKMKQEITTERLRYLKARHTLRVNIKSLAAESRFIRKEMEVCPFVQIKEELRQHRVDRLRDEARHAQLALGCLKNVPYIDIEFKAKTEPKWNKVCDKLSRMGAKFTDECKSWIEEGKLHWSRSHQV